MEKYSGLPVCEGVAVGPAFVYLKTEPVIPTEKCGDCAEEWETVSDAMQKAEERLDALYEKAKQTVGEAEAEIFEMHKLMLADEDLSDAIKDKINTEKMNAAAAVQHAGAEFAAFFEGLDDAYMKERALDVRDISALLVRILTGAEENAALETPSVIVAEDLSPSETVQLDKNKILAFVTRQGSANSHTAILARTMNVPSIVKADIPVDAAIQGKTLAVDGFDGTCWLNPNEETMAEIEKKQEEVRKQNRENEAVRGQESKTKSGQKVNLYANIGINDDIEAVIKGDAEGIGLFRSEFLYLGRSQPPSEDLQFSAYKNVAEKMGGKKVIIRTMDIGADKQVDYLGLEAEENPALGYRALRICLDRPELFKTQLRAIWRASAFGSVSVMFPMVASVWEVKECKAFLQQVKDELLAEGAKLGTLETGIMIETPAAVMLLDELAKEVDFFSVGTNDLTQYTLAADRQNASIARYADPHHPAVLKMLKMIAAAAHKNGIWAGICGELAGDAEITEKLLKMGYDELSVAPAQVLPLRRRIREME